MTVTKFTFGAKTVAKAQNTHGGQKNTGTFVTSWPATPPLYAPRWARNGKHPTVELANRLGEATNQAVMLRTKEVFRGVGEFPSGLLITPGARWRFSFHSGPYARYVMAVVYLDHDPSTSGDAYAQLDIATSTDGVSTIAATETFRYGNYSPLGPLERTVAVRKLLQINPDTDYYCTFTDVNSYLISATVHEYASLTEIFGGYLPQNFTATGPILETERQLVAEVLANQWRLGAKHLGNWNVQDQTAPNTATTTTFTNVMDASSTTVSANTPGYYFVTDGDARLSQLSGGVPVVLRAFGKVSSGNGGYVRLVGADGTTYVDFENPWSSSTPRWATATGYLLPANKTQKYDVQFAAGDAAGVATASIYAVSIFEKDP